MDIPHTTDTNDRMFSIQIRIKMGLEDVEWGGRDWIELAQDWNQWRGLLNMVMNLRVS
jgi:hypothetical protein